MSPGDDSPPSSPPRRPSASKLLLILVVLFCIAVPLVYLARTVSRYREASKKLWHAIHHEQALKAAVENFHGTYNRLPEITGGGSDCLTDGDAGVALLIVLLGDKNFGPGGHHPNFLTMPPSRSRQKGGLLYDSAQPDPKPVGFYDPWGNPYRIRIDHDYDGVIDDPMRKGNTIAKQIVLVYSDGPDGLPGTPDDVKTW